jgi:hypothetical protein
MSHTNDCVVLESSFRKQFGSHEDYNMRVTRIIAMLFRCKTLKVFATPK